MALVKKSGDRGKDAIELKSFACLFTRNLMIVAFPWLRNIDKPEMSYHDSIPHKDELVKQIEELYKMVKKNG